MKTTCLKTGGNLLLIVLSGVLACLIQQVPVMTNAQSSQADRVMECPPERQGMDIAILVNGLPLNEYYARGKSYIEAQPGAEYEIRVINPTPDRVAVALSVDGLNTIDARHTSAWNSSKWVIEPYQSITVGGWQMSTDRARRFYFTTERDSYGAKLGQTSNLGVITAVVFRERVRPISITPPRPVTKDERTQNDQSGSPNSQPRESAKSLGGVTRIPDDEYAATGIGRSVRNDVRWVQMDLESRPVAEFSIRYEYYDALLKLGIFPRRNYEPYPLNRRENARGFSPEPK